MSLNEFFSSFKKGSKLIRSILYKDSKRKKDMWNFETTKTFFRLTRIPTENVQVLAPILGLWWLHYLPNSVRDFIFRFYNNSVMVYQWLSHIIEMDRYCVFCKLSRGVQHEESFCHLFLECEHVRLVQDAIESRLLPKPQLENESFRRIRWCGMDTGEFPVNSIFIRTVYLTIQYLIWRERFNFRLPNRDFIAGELVYILDPSCKISKQFSMQKNNEDCTLSRLWSRLSRSRW